MCLGSPDLVTTHPIITTRYVNFVMGVHAKFEIMYNQHYEYVSGKPFDKGAIYLVELL